MAIKDGEALNCQLVLMLSTTYVLHNTFEFRHLL
jgi:hypothetical protein